VTSRIGIDLGGTKIEGVLLAEAGEEIARRRVPTPQEAGYDAILGEIEKVVAELRRVGGEGASVGIGIPGSPSPRDRRVRNSNTQCLNGRLFEEEIASRLGCPVRVANDANCFAVAEARLGAGRGFETVFGVILGTGVGGGIVRVGEALAGRQGISGEWGHHTLHPEGRPCFCGRRGCVERYVSGPALEARWEELTGRAKGLAEIVAEPLDTEPAAQWKREFLRDLGIGLGNVINILDPDIVVLGGGVSNVAFLYDEAAEAVRSNIFGDVRETPIVANEMGDSAGVLGAALLWG